MNMDDERIIELYFQRNDTAIAETEKKYGKYCHSIAFNILRNMEDAEECVNDTYIKTWNSIPPERPNRLALFLGKITRNRALDIYDKYNAQKRSTSTATLVYDEIKECIPSPRTIEKEIDNKDLAEKLNSFLRDLDEESRNIFLQRYWYLLSIKEIARNFLFTESKVKMNLLRTRNKLKQFLEEEGVEI